MPALQAAELVVETDLKVTSTSGTGLKNEHYSISWKLIGDRAGLVDVGVGWERVISLAAPLLAGCSTLWRSS